jgi:hypothetical protein
VRASPVNSKWSASTLPAGLGIQFLMPVEHPLQRQKCIRCSEHSLSAAWRQRFAAMLSLDDAVFIEFRTSHPCCDVRPSDAALRLLRSTKAPDQLSAGSSS